MKRLTNRQSLVTHVRIMSSLLKDEQPRGLQRMSAEELKALFNSLRKRCKDEGFIKT